MVFQIDIDEEITLLSKKKSNFYLNPINKDTIHMWSYERQKLKMTVWIKNMKMEMNMTSMQWL